MSEQGGVLRLQGREKRQPMEVRVELVVRVDEPEYQCLQLKLKHGLLDDPARQPKVYHLSPADAELLVRRLEHGIVMLRRIPTDDRLRTALPEETEGLTGEDRVDKIQLGQGGGGPTMRVELQDAAGSRIGSVGVPYTKRAPQVVIHGSRVFTPAAGPPSQGESLAYRETYAVWNNSRQPLLP